MALFSLIDCVERIPAEGATHEGLAFDVKAKPETDAFELAKDMAAFANATGGVILVGANDDGGAIIHKPLLSETEAHEAKRRYERALRDRLSPTPRVELFVLPHREKFVLAVNVWPFPGQPVGVSIGGGKASPSKGFAFPVRTATQTEWLLPEQLSMLMLPAVRYAAILLDQIPISEREVVGICSSTRLPEAGFPFADFKLHNVDAASNSVSVSLVMPDWQRNMFTKEQLQRLDDTAPRIIYVPLDAVTSVWRAPKFDEPSNPARWHIAVAGRFLGPRESCFFAIG